MEETQRSQGGQELKTKTMLHYWFLPRLPLWKHIAAIVAAIVFVGAAYGQEKKDRPPLSTGEAGKLVYNASPKGDRIPDFSYSGYMAGEQAIPDAPARVIVPLLDDDATMRIQAALDYVASLPEGPGGIRGAVLLEKGVYRINGSLEINASGVILRGSGADSEGTVLLGAGRSRETLIRIGGKDDRQLDSPAAVASAYVPVNGQQLELEPAHGIKEGDRVMVRRPSTGKWITSIGMRDFGGESGWLGWKPGERDIVWDRRVIAVEGNIIKLDAPLTTALDSAYGVGTVSVYSWPGRIRQVGVENLVCRSEYDADNPKDEAHRWMAITLENVRDAWVRQVVFEHFAGSAVAVYETGSRITVEDCKSLGPVSEIGGFRRYTFFTSGQQTLFQRLYAEGGYHDFAAGFMAAGPNAFVQCKSYRPYSFSGAIDSWASGLLLDNITVDGQEVGFQNRGQDAQGAGWTAANSVLWQISAAKALCYSPPGAQNWAFGIWAAYAGNGYWANTNDHVEPRSLYYTQLADRLGDSVKKRAAMLPLQFSSTSSPTVEQAAELAEESFKPLPLLKNWISQAAQRNPIPVETAGLKSIDQLMGSKQASGTADESGSEVSSRPAPMKVENGWLVQAGSVLSGGRHDVRWWRGDPRPYGARESSMHVTRYVPGRTGHGYTDDIAAVTDTMKARHIVALEHNYGLWYDRRRDDHQRVRRMNGEVWAPFYELPFARSGLDTAWDGLSKYDLSKYNYWYWSRLHDFARQAAKKHLLLIHKQYFQHNILEAGAHWADFPWRSANNINETGFPEPPPYAGDKRIFMARQFYDTTNAARRELHRAYIRKCLENFSDGGNVLQLTSAEFTGPLHFMQFWINTVKEWEAETGNNSLTGLSATKDVQDAILDDPGYASTVDVIDIRYWHYRDDGSVYAPGGGLSMAPRQHARKESPGKASAQQVYRAVSQYRTKYPEKAVIYSAGSGYEYPWAVFMAGGSLAPIPRIEVSGFLEAAASMHPAATGGEAAGERASWVLQNENGEQIVYARPGQRLEFGKAAGSRLLYRIDPDTGRQLGEPGLIPAGSPVQLENKESVPVVFWVSAGASNNQ